LMGSDSPAWGLLVTWMANGTACGFRSLFLGTSRKTWIRSSMKLSGLAVAVVGTCAAIGIALSVGTLSGKSAGLGVSG
jgi:hypothetical protein